MSKKVFISIKSLCLKKAVFIFTVILLSGISCNAFAHFGVLIPDDDIFEDASRKEIGLIAAFIHPFEQKAMDIGGLKEVGVVIGGNKMLLNASARKILFLNKNAFNLHYKIKRPGDHIFYMVPKPYWEGAEGKFIQHITKVIVNAYGLEDSWDKPVGLKAEIVPATRPYGLWTGNIFCAQVLFDGKPLKSSHVEVEYFNNGLKLKAPKEAYITQVIKTDTNGRFCYGIPKGGWWGFSALNEIEDAMVYNGQNVPLEVGAVIWIRARDIE